MFVGGDTRDAITRAKRNALPGNTGSESFAVGIGDIPEIILAVLEAVW
jgi:hypothetical protein